MQFTQVSSLFNQQLFLGSTDIHIISRKTINKQSFKWNLVYNPQQQQQQFIFNYYLLEANLLKLKTADNKNARQKSHTNLFAAKNRSHTSI